MREARKQTHSIGRLLLPIERLCLHVRRPNGIQIRQVADAIPNTGTPDTGFLLRISDSSTDNLENIMGPALAPLKSPAVAVRLALIENAAATRLAAIFPQNSTESLDL